MRMVPVAAENKEAQQLCTDSAFGVILLRAQAIAKPVEITTLQMRDNLGFGDAERMKAGKAGFRGNERDSLRGFFCHQCGIHFSMSAGRLFSLFRLQVNSLRPDAGPHGAIPDTEHSFWIQCRSQPDAADANVASRPTKLVVTGKTPDRNRPVGGDA